MRRKRQSEDSRVSNIELKPWKCDGPRSSAWRLSRAVAKGVVLFVAIVSTIYFFTNPNGLRDLAGGAIPSSISRLFTSDVAIPEDAIVKGRDDLRQRVADTMKPAKKARKSQAKTPPYLAIGIAAEDVLKIQGQPDRMDADVWQYGTSRVYFVAGRVAGWSSSNERPLKVKTN